MPRKNVVLWIIVIASFALALMVAAICQPFGTTNDGDWQKTLVIARGVLDEMNMVSASAYRTDDDDSQDCLPDDEDMKRAILLLPPDHGPVFIRKADDCFVLNEKICSKKNKQEKKIVCCHYDLAPIPCDEAHGIEIRMIF